MEDFAVRFVVGPKIAEKLKAGVAFGVLGRWQYDADDVEAETSVLLAEQSAVDTGCSRNLALLAQIHVSLGLCEVSGCSCFNLNEAERRAFVSHYVDFGADGGAVQISSDRHFKISRHNSVPDPLKIFGCQVLAPLAECRCSATAPTPL